MKIKYSFVIPSFNSSKTIERCLKSIKHQKIKNNEIIVVDDCSTDNTIEIARRYADLIIIKDKRSGPAKSRNLGWKMSKGDIIIFIDSDVYLGKNWAKEILPLLKKYDGVVSSLKSNSHDVTFEEWEEAVNFFVIKRKVLEKVGGYSEIFPYAAGEDSDLLIRILKKGYKIRNHKVNYIHDTSHKRYRKDNILKKFYKVYFWILVCNLKNIDVPRCREFLFLKIPLKCMGLLEKYKMFKKRKMKKKVDNGKIKI
jgi:glycosyltransferase involved in cell wall biosynthesis